MIPADEIFHVKNTNEHVTRSPEFYFKNIPNEDFEIMDDTGLFFKFLFLEAEVVGFSPSLFYKATLTKQLSLEVESCYDFQYF